MPREYEFDDCGNNEVQHFVPPPPMREQIEVEFSEEAPSGVETWDFDEVDEYQGRKPPRAWSEAFIAILETNQFVSWKPSFPLRYPWTRECSKKALLEAYKKAGRDKFVTLRFARENKHKVLSIAQQLRELPEIKQVAAVPEIAPPHTAPAPHALSNPLAEPYTGESDQMVPICGPAPCLMNQWYLFRCGVPEAWALSASGNGVVIADIDWGFDLTHPDLAHTQLSQNMLRDSPNVSDGNLLFHGNGVLGLAGAAINGQGMAGIAYRATLWAIQAGTGAINSPVVEPEFWVAAIDFVRTTPARGRKIIILELQTAGYSNAESILSVNREIILAINEGIVVCVPAGNGNRSRDAGLSDGNVAITETGSIVVGATRFDAEKNIRAGSNGGDRVTVYAPGDSESDLTCGIRGGYRDHFGGTSGATAKVAGVVALMLEKNNRLTPQEVRTILHRSQKRAVDEDSNDVGVFLDAEQAVGDAILARGAAEGTLSAARMEREAA
jgi:subtilisin family serine protease